MNELIRKILDLPKWQRLSLWALSLLLVLYVFWQFFYSEVSEQLTATTSEVEKLSIDIASEQRLAKELPKIKEAVMQLDKRLAELVRELPDKREIPSLLSSISGLAKDAGLEVDLFKPRAEIVRDFYAEVPVSISVAGTYHQVATFFDEVGRLDRIVNISEISMIDPLIDRDGKRVKLKTSCVATTFRYLDEDERKAREEAMKRAGRRR
jgi:type IV pilus assembly protein PilO